MIVNEDKLLWMYKQINGFMFNSDYYFPVKVETDKGETFIVSYDDDGDVVLRESAIEVMFEYLTMNADV